MKFNPSIAAPFLVAMATAANHYGAETGDFDGDGRLSIADVLHRMEDHPSSSGSMEGFALDPDHAAPDLNASLLRYKEAGTTYLEALRRSVPDPLPHWAHFFEDFLAQPPLPHDPRITFSLGQVVVSGGLNDRYDLPIRLITSVRLRAFSLILEDTQRLLRVPFDDPGLAVDRWSYITSGTQSTLGDLRVIAPTAGFLITNGRYVLHFGLTRSELIEPGVYRIVIPVRLPKDTPAGRITKIRILESSEAVPEDVFPVQPAVGESVDLVVENAVEVGWNEGVPPLSRNPETNEILGEVQFRITNGAGVAPVNGDPVAEVAPGENIKIRVQMRTEVPLNTASFRIEWQSENLRCLAYGEDAVKVIFENPEDGEIYPPLNVPNNSSDLACEKGWILPANHHASFHLGGDFRPGIDKYQGRPLEYYKPLNEWRDLTEVEFHLSGCALPGDEIPITFRRFLAGDGNSHPGPGFSPYHPTYLWGSNITTENWIYNLEYFDSFIRVIDGVPHCPEAVPDPGVRYALGNVRGRPGQEVKVPILVSTESAAEKLRLAVESVPPIAASGAEIDIVSLRSGEIVEEFVPRGANLTFRECEDPRDESTCTYGYPGHVAIYATADPQYTLVSLEIRPYPFDSHSEIPDYPGKSLVEVGRLRFLIPEDFSDSEIRLISAKVPIPAGLFTLTIENGGFSAGDFYHVKEFAEGSIKVITGLGQSLVRGDANFDDKADLSDAVSILGFLFLAKDTPVCLDAADADDSGVVEITDAIFLLGALFLGDKTIPPPYPDCGTDPTADDELSCEKGCTKA